MIEQLHSRLDLTRLAGHGHKPLVRSRSSTRWRATSRTSCGSRARFHNPDRAARYAANLVDLGAAFADDTSDQVVGDVDLLGLRWDLRWRRV